MSIYQDAFGTFAPHTDPDAAIKFSLQVLALDHRLPDLVAVLTDGSKIGGIGGVPGWELERRDDVGLSSGFEDWPADAKFRAFVDPQAFALGSPERFYTRAEVLAFVRAIVRAYTARHPDRADELNPVISLLQASRRPNNRG